MGSLEINSLALNTYYFSYSNVIQNGVNALFKMVFKKHDFFFFFVKKLKFCEVRSVPFTLNFTSMWFKYLSNNVWRVKTSNVSISNGSREDFLRQIYSVQKLIFRSGFFYITTIADADIGSLMQPSKNLESSPFTS